MPAQPRRFPSLVVCESMFGNTRAIADTVADSLAARFDRVDVVDVDDAPHSLTGVSLLVVGAPTHALGLSRPSTREAATRRAPRHLPTRRTRMACNARTAGRADLRCRLRHPGTQAVPAGQRGEGDAAASTPARLPGARADELRRRRHPGPLVDGELDRARQWAASLEAMARPAVSRS